MAVLSPLANIVDGISCNVSDCNGIFCDKSIDFGEDVRLWKHPQGVFLCESDHGSEPGYLYGKGAKWEIIKEKIEDHPYNSTLYLALIGNYEWLTKHQNYNWFNDANYCYIYYRNFERGWIFWGANYFFAFLFFILLMGFIILYCALYRLFCKNQATILLHIIPIIFIIYTVVYDWDIAWDFFSFISSGYGRRPAYTIWLSILVIIIYTFLYRKYSLIKTKEISGNHSWCQYMLFSAAVFVSAPIKLNELLTSNVGDNPSRNIMIFLEVAEKALGLLLFAIFIASLSNVVIIRSGLS